MDGKMITRMIACVVLLTIPFHVSSLGIHADDSTSDTQVGPDASRYPAADTYVFVHSVGLASWAWYRVEAMLQGAGFTTVALDMPGHGKDKTVADTIQTLSFYAKPLTDFLAKSPKKVILVGHGMGGAAVSYAMETYPEKIAKAVFLSAIMPLSEQSSIDIINGTFDFLQPCYVMHFEDPNNPNPTSVRINVTNARFFLFNRSPAQDFTLATHLIEDTPSVVYFDTMKLTAANYGSISRYYIRTGMDRIIPWDYQQKIIANNPPKLSFTLKNGDHCSFFSETPWLSKILKEIAYTKD